MAGVERAPADLAQIWSAGYVVSLDISLDHVRNEERDIVTGAMRLDVGVQVHNKI
jgi:hypothetical protein